MSLGNRLKTLRKKKGLNQTELGEILGVTLNTVFNMESGKSDVPSEILKKASEFFEVSADYLLFGTETERTISENEQEILEILRKDDALTQAIKEAAKLKKKAISYLVNYKQPEQNAAMG